MFDVASLSEVANFRPNSIRGDTAWVGHVHFASWLAKAKKPKIFVELGTFAGNSYFAFCQTIKEFRLGTQAYAVDTWAGDIHMGQFDDSFYQIVVEENKKYSDFSQLIRKTFDDAAHGFLDKSIDLLHIDGTHTYEAVKNDFETWYPKLAPGAVVIFHDTNVHRDDFGVYKFWSELSRDYSTFEFFHSHGLGVLEIPGGNAQIAAFLKSNEKAVREYFSGVGNLFTRVIETELKLSDLEKSNQNLRETEQSLSEKLIRCNSAMHESQEILFEMRRSLSWRLTTPVRNFLALFLK